MDSAVQAVPHTVLSHPTSLFMLWKKEKKNLISLYKISGYGMLDLHATWWYGCEARVCGNGLKRGQMDLFSTLSASGMWKKYYILHSFFSPKRTSCGVKWQQKRLKISMTTQVLLPWMISPTAELSAMGMSAGCGPAHPTTERISFRIKTVFLWLLSTSILNKMSNEFICPLTQVGIQSIGSARKALLVSGTKKCVNAQRVSTLKQ